MTKHFLINGKLTFLGIICLVMGGFFIAYISLQFIPWKVGKLVGLGIGLAVAGLGGFSGRAHALDLPAPFTNDPLGWRKAKESYKNVDKKESVDE